MDFLIARLFTNQESLVIIVSVFARSSSSFWNVNMFYRMYAFVNVDFRTDW